MVILKQFVLGQLENNNFLVIDEASKEAALIDCSEFSPEVVSELEKNNAKLKYILLTHAHFDHILGINDYKQKYPNFKVLVHEDDKELMESVSEFVKKFGMMPAEMQHLDETITESTKLNLGETEIKVIHTPGHTKGGVCYLVGDDLFTGDTLFYESVGRTDLPGGSFEEIKSSIENKLFTLDENIKVYPGHGWTSTIGHEKINNRFL